jgi:hypothetical protein
MAKLISTQILINASATKVWEVLTQFQNYPKWNPFIKLIKFNDDTKSSLTVSLQPPNAKGMTFKPKVLVFTANKEFRWIGKLLMPGILDGEHLFELIDNGNTTTTFIQSEKFTGILIPFLKKMLEVDTKSGFELMNKKLKEVAEG